MSLRPPTNQRSLFEPGLLYPRLFGDPTGPAGCFEFFANKVMPTLWSLRSQLARMYTADNRCPALGKTRSKKGDYSAESNAEMRPLSCLGQPP
jgi:hypothetical protein